MTKIAVVGHVEWVDFLRIGHLPVRDEVQRAKRAAIHAGGGAVVAAAVLADLGAEVDFFCALGSDANGDAAEAELTQRGIRIHAVRRPGPTREVLTLLDDSGERTIITLGERIQPQGDDELEWDRLQGAAGVYFTAGDLAAVRYARQARDLVVTPRIRERLGEQDVTVDAVVFSASDDDEARWAENLQSHARLVVATEGSAGGRWWGESEGRWTAATPPGPVRDSYGCGDAFAAGFTYGLATGTSVGEAAEIGARCGAEMLTRVGAP
jgi:ribokinase